MLPTELTRYFADSQLRVESYSDADRRLVVRIEKEIGPETGLIDFRQVSFVALPTALPGDGMRAHAIDDANPEFWVRSMLLREDLEADDVLFEIFSQDGPTYYVVAKSIAYEVVT